VVAKKRTKGKGANANGGGRKHELLGAKKQNRKFCFFDPDNLPMGQRGRPGIEGMSQGAKLFRDWRNVALKKK